MMEKTSDFYDAKKYGCSGNEDSMGKSGYVKRIVYMKSHGECQLCGGDISLDEMVLDYVSSPPINGGEKVDDVQGICQRCNQIKGNMPTKNFIDKITEIFVYQLEKQFSDDCSWKIARNIIMSIL